MINTALVTGANSGLGYCIAHRLAASGVRVGMLVRDRARGAIARDQIAAATGNEGIRLFVADLGDQQALRHAADEVTTRFERLDLLVNNAGTAFPRHALTKEGIERAFAVNHLGPFLLTQQLLALIKASAPAHILNIGTRMNTRIDFEDLHWSQRPYRMMQAYGQSKLGNLHFTFELARRLQGSGVTVNCVFPGIFRSNLGGTDGAQGLFWKSIDRTLGWALPTPSQAAERVFKVLTLAQTEGMSGVYHDGRRPLKAPAQAMDPAANQRLWEISEHLITAQPSAG